MRGNDSKLVSVRRRKVWKDYMKMIINEENDWEDNVEWDAVEDPTDCVSRRRRHKR